MTLHEARTLIGYLEKVADNRGLLIRQDHTTNKLTKISYTVRDLLSSKGIKLVKYLVESQQKGDKMFVQYPETKLVKVDLLKCLKQN